MKPKDAHKYPPRVVKELFERFPIIHEGEQIMIHNAVDVFKNDDVYRLYGTSIESRRAADYVGEYVRPRDYEYITPGVAEEFPQFGLEVEDYDMIVIDPETECNNCQSRILKHPQNYNSNQFLCATCHKVPEARAAHEPLDKFVD